MAAASALALCACGGGNDDPPTAADCFNPQLFKVGTQYKLDYRISGSLPGTQSQSISVQASPDTGPADVIMVTDFGITHDVPVSTASDPLRTRDVLTIDGQDIVTKAEYQSFVSPGPGLEMPTVYDPPLRDRRYSLAQGQSFSLVRSGSQTTTYSTTITYLGEESVTVPAGTFTACKFEERYADGSAIDTWVLQAKGILAKRVAGGTTQELVDFTGI